MRNEYNISVGKSGRKRPTGRPRRRWEDNIQMYLQEMCADVYWIHIAQERLQWQGVLNTVTNFCVP
jgi:hypothetical protein